VEKDKKKIKILFYSDCPFFGGSENMLVSIFSNPNIHKEFEIVFAYRYSKKYAEIFHSRLKININEIPLKLAIFIHLFDEINKLKINLLVKKILKAISILCFKHIFFICNIFKLFIIFRRVKPDILHINNGGYPGAYSCISAVFAAKFARINKIVFVINNIITPYNNVLRYIDKPFDKFVKNNVSIFLTGSKYAGNKIRDLWNLPKEKVINIPNTVLPRPLVEPKEMIFKRLGISSSNIILGNIALLEPRKGQKYLIEALADIRDKFDNFKNVILIIEGTGNQKKYLEKLMADLKLEKNVLFLENEKNIFDIINIFDVFILPSIEYEDFPNVTLEAMSLGKPIIGTNIAGIPEQIKNGINGFVVEPKNVKSLSEAILRLIQCKEKRIKMGAKSFDRFNKFFSYDKIINNYINLYKGIVDYNNKADKDKIV